MFIFLNDPTGIVIVKLIFSEIKAGIKDQHCITLASVSYQVILIFIAFFRIIF